MWASWVAENQKNSLESPIGFLNTPIIIFGIFISSYFLYTVGLRV